MRIGERCPRCGYMETRNWRPSPYNWDVDVMPVSEFRMHYGEDILRKLPTGNRAFIMGQWAYRRGRSYVERQLASTWLAYRRWRYRKGFLDRGPGHKPFPLKVAAGRRGSCG